MAMAKASFGFQMADRQIRRVVALTCENHNHNRVSLWYLLLARALRGIQSPGGEGTEISLL